MLHDFAVAIATFITIMGSVLAHDAQQISATIGNFLHPAATSIKGLIGARILGVHSSRCRTLRAHRSRG
jgi:hypothetical protein